MKSKRCLTVSKPTLVQPSVAGAVVPLETLPEEQFSEQAELPSKEELIKILLSVLITLNRLRPSGDVWFLAFLGARDQMLAAGIDGAKFDLTIEAITAACKGQKSQWPDDFFC